MKQKTADISGSYYTYDALTTDVTRHNAIYEQKNHPRNKKNALLWPVYKGNDPIFGWGTSPGGQMLQNPF